VSTAGDVTGLLISTFCQEAQACGTGVVCANARETASVVARLLENDRSIMVAASLEGLAGELRGCGLNVVTEDNVIGTSADVIAQADAGVGKAFAGIAVSGSVLVCSQAGPAGLLAILPPHCILLLDASTIESDLAGALGVAAPLISQPGARVAIVTGPSRTSDIELTPVVGVHGPLRLDVVVIDG
jgi:L-lactate dehydrogenase complex protein LldG